MGSQHLIRDGRKPEGGLDPRGGQEAAELSPGSRGESFRACVLGALPCFHAWPLV